MDLPWRFEVPEKQRPKHVVGGQPNGFNAHLLELEGKTRSDKVLSCSSNLQTGCTVLDLGDTLLWWVQMLTSLPATPSL
jgi:hypothetical protein